MAVRLEGSIRRWVGLSTDTKPAPGQTGFDPATNTSAPIVANDVPAGSTFLEENTGLIYRWNGVDTWSRAPAEESEQLYVLEALLAELTQLRQMVEVIIGA